MNTHPDTYRIVNVAVFKILKENNINYEKAKVHTFLQSLIGDIKETADTLALTNETYEVHLTLEYLEHFTSPVSGRTIYNYNHMLMTGKELCEYIHARITEMKK